MRIAVDATCWHNRRGYGRHARALLMAIQLSTHFGKVRSGRLR